MKSGVLTFAELFETFHIMNYLEIHIHTQMAHDHSVQQRTNTNEPKYSSFEAISFLSWQIV